ncbi:MAG: hypothetical protein ACI4RA_03550, partial [Kiritimatiellia bacterium]
MTDEQIAAWKKERDIAREIADPESRRKALEAVYDHRDEMQMTCIAHQSKRQKEMIADLAAIKRDHPALVAHLREVEKEKLRFQGMARAWRILRWL